MEGRTFYSFPRGEPVPLAEMRRIQAQADRTGRGFVTGADGALGDGGLVLNVPAPPGIWLKITSQLSISQAFYGGTEVVDDGPGTFVVPGNAIVVPDDAAYEVGGNLAVPTGGTAIVRAWPSATVSGGWDFSYPASTAPAYGLDSGEYYDGFLSAAMTSGADWVVTPSGSPAISNAALLQVDGGGKLAFQKAGLYMLAIRMGVAVTGPFAGSWLKFSVHFVDAGSARDNVTLLNNQPSIGYLNAGVFYLYVVNIGDTITTVFDWSGFTGVTISDFWIFALRVG